MSFIHPSYSLQLIRLFCLVATLGMGLAPLQAEPPEEIEAYAKRVQDEVLQTLDVESGQGTGMMARQLREVAQELEQNAQALLNADLDEAPVTLTSIRDFILAGNNGQPLKLEVHNYQRAIAQANKRLSQAGIDFIHVLQSPQAQLIEQFREWNSPLTSKTIAVAALAETSHTLYPGLNTPTAMESSVVEADEGQFTLIGVPVEREEANLANHLLRKRGILGYRFHSTLEQDAVPVLPLFDAPLAGHAKAKQRLSVLRQWISPPLALFGTAMGSGFSAQGGVAGLAAFGLEKQFITFSHKWAKFWDRFGFAGNIAVNAAYGVVVTATLMAAEKMLGQPNSVNGQEFFVKSFLIGTATFVGSFGAMQIASARLQHLGEFSEHGRFRLETFSVLWNNFGRVLAIGASGLGLQYSLFKVGEVNFGMGELIGWGIQAAYFTAVTAPMWLKLWVADAAYDRVTRQSFENLQNTQQDLSTGSPGWLSHLCTKTLSRLAGLYTVNRR